LTHTRSDIDKAIAERTAVQSFLKNQYDELNKQQLQQQQNGGEVGVSQHLLYGTSSAGS